MTVINFDELSEEIKTILKKETTIVFATTWNNKVTARTVSHVNDELTIYFPAGESSEKLQQIKNNPNIACAVDNMQIEAVAKICGDFNENPYFKKLYETKFPRYFEAYKILGNEVVIKITPKKIKLWKYFNGVPCFDIAELNSKTAYREKQTYFNRK